MKWLLGVREKCWRKREASFISGGAIQQLLSTLLPLLKHYRINRVIISLATFPQLVSPYSNLRPTSVSDVSLSVSVVCAVGKDESIELLVPSFKQACLRIEYALQLLLQRGPLYRPWLLYTAERDELDQCLTQSSHLL